MNNKLFKLTASEIMTKKPTTGDKNMLVGEVLNIMNTKKITNLQCRLYFKTHGHL